MNKNDFARVRLIYKSLQIIAEKKQAVLRDLVAYAEDPVRYRRRLRFLKELTQYEGNLLESFENFQTNFPEEDFDDTTLQKIEESVELITLVNA